MVTLQYYSGVSTVGFTLCCLPYTMRGIDSLLFIMKACGKSGRGNHKFAEFACENYKSLPLKNFWINHCIDNGSGGSDVGM